MKLIRVIIGLLLLSMGVSCTRTLETTEHWKENAVPRVVAIDSLLQEQPDSALAYLESFVSDALNSPEKEYASLMLSEACFKVRREVAYCEEVSSAMAYFDSVFSVFPKDKDLAFLSARSHYMNAICINGGLIFEDDSTTMQSCQEFYRALDIMERHFGEDAINGHKASFMALVFARLANIYSDKFLIEPTTYFYKEVLNYKKRASASPSSLCNTLFFLGYEFEKSEQYDSALFYYDQSLAYMTDTTGVLYRNVINRKALSSYQVDHDAQASIDALKHIAATGKDFELNDRLLGIGYIYKLDQQYDSAIVYLTYVFEAAPNLFLKTQSAEYLSDIYEVLGEQEKAGAYARFVTQNTPPEFGTKADEWRYTNLFQNYLKQQQDRSLQHERLQSRDKAMRWIVALLLVLVGLLVWLFVYRRRHKRSEAEKEALSGQLLEHKEALATMKKRVEAASFVEEPVCRHILGVVREQQFKSKVDYLYYKEFALGKEDLLALREAADRHYGQFTSRLRETYPSLTKGDIDYCCLYLLGLEEADIAALMQRAFNTVCERSRKLKAVFGEDAPLSSMLRNIANGGLNA